MSDANVCTHPKTQAASGFTDLLKRFGFKQHKLWREVCMLCREDAQEWHDPDCLSCMGRCQ